MFTTAARSSTSPYHVLGWSNILYRGSLELHPVCAITMSASLRVVVKVLRHYRGTQDKQSHVIWCIVHLMFQQSTESVQFEEGETSYRLYALLFFVEQYHHRTFTDWKQNANLLTSTVCGLAHHSLYMYTVVYFRFWLKMVSWVLRVFGR